MARLKKNKLIQLYHISPHSDLVAVPCFKYLFERCGLCPGDPYSELDEDVRRELGQPRDQQQQQRQNNSEEEDGEQVAFAPDSNGANGAYRPE